MLDAPSISRIPYKYFTTIADIPGFNFLVSGRKPLHEIVVSEIHVASTWTGNFNPTPKIVGPFIDSDIRAFAKEFQKLHQVDFPEDVTAEILKQTGGNPLLVKELLEGILKDVPSGNSSLNKPLVKKISKELSNEPSMWNRLVRLPDERKAILTAVLNEPDTSTFPRGYSREIDRLKSEGLIEETDTNKLRLSCEMIRLLIPDLQTENKGYVDSFAKKEDYDNNIWRILNFRVKHLEALDFKGSIGLLENIRHAIDGLSVIRLLRLHLSVKSIDSH